MTDVVIFQLFPTIPEESQTPVRSVPVRTGVSAPWFIHKASPSSALVPRATAADVVSRVGRLQNLVSRYIIMNLITKIKPSFLFCHSSWCRLHGAFPSRLTFQPVVFYLFCLLLSGKCYESVHLRYYDTGESWGRIHLRNVEQCTCMAGKVNCERVHYTSKILTLLSCVRLIRVLLHKASLTFSFNNTLSQHCVLIIYKACRKEKEKAWTSFHFLPHLSCLINCKYQVSSQ